MGEADQAARDAAVEAALWAYHGRDRRAAYAEQFKLWEALWEACDFSWEGLADAGWERGDGANFAQKLKRWEIDGEPKTLQDYWLPRELGAGEVDLAQMAAGMRADGLLVDVDGRLWHVLHRPETHRIAPALDEMIGERLSAAAEAEATAGNPLRLTGARARQIDGVLRQWMAADRKLHLSAWLAGFPAWSTSHVAFGKADFRYATFGDKASFAGATFGDEAGFVIATFGDKASFVGATFGDEAGFEGAIFGDEAGFTSATFGGRAVFRGATFGDGAGFMTATFGDGAWFEGATFGDKARFGGAIFGGSVTFVDARFGGQLDADGARFRGHLDFRAAEIKGHAGFSRCIWPAKAEDAEGAFEGCRFRDVADFRGTGFSAYGLFDGAEFKGRVLLNDPGAREEDRLFRQALVAAQAAADTNQGWADLHFSSLAGGLRTLKLAMAAQGDRDREQRFFRYEVQARARRPGEPWLARIAAQGYAVTSDYGASIGRPLVWIGGVLLGFALIYLWASYGITLEPAGQTAWARFLQAFDFSAANSFRPFSALDAPRADDGRLGAQLLRWNDATAVGVRTLGVLQSISTFVLLFLVGLALKRKFQIG